MTEKKKKVPPTPAGSSNVKKTPEKDVVMDEVEEATNISETPVVIKGFNDLLPKIPVECPKSLDEKISLLKELEDRTDEGALIASFNLVDIKYNEYYKKYSPTFKAFVEEKLEMLFVTAYKLVRAGEIFLQNGLDLKIIPNIKWKMFMCYAPLLQDGILTRDDFIKDHLPLIERNGPKSVPRPQIEKIISRIKTSVTTDKPARMSVSFEGDDYSLAESAIETVRANPAYAESNLSDICMSALSKLATVVGNDTPPVFTQAYDALKILGSVLPVGIAPITLIYDTGSVRTVIDNMAKSLKKQTSVSVDSIDCKEYVEKFLSKLPKVYVNGKKAIVTSNKEFAVSQGCTGNDLEVVLDPDLIPEGAHFCFPAQIVDTTATPTPPKPEPKKTEIKIGSIAEAIKYFNDINILEEKIPSTLFSKGSISGIEGKTSVLFAALISRKIVPHKTIISTGNNIKKDLGWDNKDSDKIPSETRLKFFELLWISLSEIAINK